MKRSPFTQQSSKTVDFLRILVSIKHFFSRRGYLQELQNTPTIAWRILQEGKKSKKSQPIVKDYDTLPSHI